MVVAYFPWYFTRRPAWKPRPRSRVVGHARGRDLTGLKNDKKIDFVNFTLMATENYWFNCNEIYNQ